MTATYTKENFSNATGKMDYNQFARYADQVGINQTIWIAKNFGVALSKVRSFVRLYLGNNKSGL